MPDTKKTIAVDFDGVLNLYQGWTGDKADLSTPRDGAREFLVELNRLYRVVLFTTRNIGYCWAWLRRYEMDRLVDEVTHTKPMAVAYIDDRAVCFRGSFEETLQEVHDFKTHWEESP